MDWRVHCKTNDLFDGKIYKETHYNIKLVKDRQEWELKKRRERIMIDAEKAKIRTSIILKKQLIQKKMRDHLVQAIDRAEKN
jgi:hypothetical protein